MTVHLPATTDLRCDRCGGMSHSVRLGYIQAMVRMGTISASDALSESERVLSGADCDEALAARVLDS